MNRQIRRMIYNGMRDGNVYHMERRYDRGRIGYGEQERYEPEEMYDRYDRDPYERRDGMDRGYMDREPDRRGYAGGYEGGGLEDMLERPISIGEAMRWAENLKGGPHWKTDEVKKLAPQVGVKTDGVEFAEFYAWVNALYCDYHQLFAKYGINRPEVYAEMAKATMNDEDAVPNKGAVYYRFIVDEE